MTARELVVADLVSPTGRSMLGASILHVDKEGVHALKIRFDNGWAVVFNHHQECRESVEIKEIAGDLADLLGPLLSFECYTSDGDTDYGIERYTFYTFRTICGTVTVNWYGESNGYYSVEVHMDWIREGTS